jgi:IPT/TIG domain
MKSRVVSVFSQGWFAVVTGFLLFNVAAANAQTPTIANITPASAAAGGPAFRITVTGTNYNMSSVVRWNGNDRVTTVFASGTTLEAAITALDIASAGTAQITVFNPGPAGGQTSNSVTFTITGEAPTVTSISPSSTVAGGPAFTLTVTGTNFTSTSIVQWNGTNRTTTFVDATRLTAAIAAADIAQPGTATVRVTTGAVNSNSVNFTITLFSSLYFPQVVTGGGYSTVIAFNNLGSSPATGNLILTDSLGSPFVVSLNETPVSFQPSEEPLNIDGSSFGVTVPAAGARVFLATSLTPNQTRTGWARFESTSAGVAGLSTFLLSEGLTLRSVAGVFASQPVEFATIGLDNSLSQGRFTGFSIANPTNENINIRLVVLNADGNITDTLSPPELNPLGPQRQVSKFLHEYLPARATFRGSMVLVAQSGRRFVATALIQFQGLLTATPVTPDKPAAVTN